MANEELSSPVTDEHGIPSHVVYGLGDVAQRPGRSTRQRISRSEDYSESQKGITRKSYGKRMSRGVDHGVRGLVPETDNLGSHT